MATIESTMFDLCANVIHPKRLPGTAASSGLIKQMKSASGVLNCYVIRGQKDTEYWNTQMKILALVATNGYINEDAKGGFAHILPLQRL